MAQHCHFCGKTPMSGHRVSHANNLTNRSNYLGYSGTMTSPFFERPTAVANPRKVDLSISFGF